MQRGEHFQGQSTSCKITRSLTHSAWDDHSTITRACLSRCVFTFYALSLSFCASLCAVVVVAALLDKKRSHVRVISCVCRFASNASLHCINHSAHQTRERRVIFTHSLIARARSIPRPHIPCAYACLMRLIWARSHERTCFQVTLHSSEMYSCFSGLHRGAERGVRGPAQGARGRPAERADHQH